MIAHRPWLGVSTRDWFINSDTPHCRRCVPPSCTRTTTPQAAGGRTCPAGTGTGTGTGLSARIAGCAVRERNLVTIDVREPVLPAQATVSQPGAVRAGRAAGDVEVHRLVKQPRAVG
jgi:hypothetical protein